MLVLTCYEFRETDENDQKAKNKKPIIALPNVAYLRLDKDGQKVLHKRVETGENLQEKFDLKQKEAISMDFVGIFSKPIIDDKGDLFLLFSNPLFKSGSRLDCKEITDDSNDDMQDEDLKFTLVAFPDNFKEVF